MVPQTPVIFEGTIKENLAIGSIFSEVEEINSILEDFQLNKGLNENAINLSGGEKQRLAIARAILMNPEVLMIVFLPGLMTGQILSGTSPIVAIEYQIAIILGIVGSVSLSVILFLHLGYKQFFNERSQLILDYD